MPRPLRSAVPVLLLIAGAAACAGDPAPTGERAPVPLSQAPHRAAPLSDLVIRLAPGDPELERSIVSAPQYVVVASGPTAYSAEGAVAIGDWRFTVDRRVTGDAAPIVVVKQHSQAALTELLERPAAFSALGRLADRETLARLGELIDSAPTTGPYTHLMEVVTKPAWTGVLVFNASVSALPDRVQGQSTAAYDGARIDAFAIGATGIDGSSGFGGSSVFGTIDHRGAPSLRAQFENSALTSVVLGTD